MNFETLPRVYDAELNEVDNPERIERLGNLAQDEIYYILDNYPADEAVLMERYAVLSAVDWRQGRPYLTIEDGQIVQHDDVSDGLTNAFTHAVVRQGNQTITGIYYGDELAQFDLSHEVFHALSTSVRDFVDPRTGNFCIKRGLQSVLLTPDWRLIDHPMNISPNDQALNEGVTELLAKRFQQRAGATEARSSFDYHKERQIILPYKQWVDLADILSAPEHDQVITAYFADDPLAPLAFLEDFDRRQNYIDANELKTMEQPVSGMLIGGGLPDGFVDERVAIGAVEYAVSFYGDEESLEAEWQRVVPIAQRIIQRNLNLIRLNPADEDAYRADAFDTLARIYDAKLAEL